MFHNPIHMMSKRKTRTVKNPLCGNVLSDQRIHNLACFVQSIHWEDVFWMVLRKGRLGSIWLWNPGKVYLIYSCYIKLPTNKGWQHGTICYLPPSSSTTTIIIEHVLSLETLIHKRGAARDVEWNLGISIPFHMRLGTLVYINQI